MKSINKKIFLAFLVFLFFFGFTSFVFAENNGNSRIRELETAYPDFGFETITAPSLVTTPLHEYVLYIYYFIIIASGLFGFFSLIYAGFVYIVSAGDPHLLENAKGQIIAAFFGILILFGAVLLLRTLSEEFIVMDETFMLPGRPEIAPGVWVCTEHQSGNFQKMRNLYDEYEETLELFRQATSENSREFYRNQLEEHSTEGRMTLREILNFCYIIQTAQNIAFEQGATYSYFVPTKLQRDRVAYGAIYFQGLNQTGDITMSFGGPIGLGTASLPTGGARSILPFTYNYFSTPDPEWEVWVYERVNQNAGFDPDSENARRRRLDCDAYRCPAPPATLEPHHGGDAGYLGSLDFPPLSFSITPTAEYILILNSGGDFETGSHVFTRTVDNLIDFPRISEEIVDERLDYKAYRVPTATHYFLINAITY